MRRGGDPLCSLPPPPPAGSARQENDLCQNRMGRESAYERQIEPGENTALARLKAMQKRKQAHASPEAKAEPHTFSDFPSFSAILYLI